MPPKRNPSLQVSWTAITYRSVMLLILAGLGIVGAATYFAFPESTKRALDQGSSLVARLLEKMGIAAPTRTIAAGPQQAHFTNIDGTVRVKKTNSNTWINADYSTPLEKGDVVQTASEGIAKVVFADGSSYTVKQDSLIVVEENSTNSAQQTQVSVQVTTGTVDLTTATYAEGSKSQVVVAGARASMAPESSAQVRNDPRGDDHEILVKKGAAEVARNGEVVHIANYEKVNFKLDAKTLTKAKVIGPPTLISPTNMAPIFSTATPGPIQFAWSPVENTSGYHLRVSRNPYFSSLVVDKRVTVTQLIVSGLTDGAYYWAVQTLDGEGRESVESEKNRFTIIAKGKDKIVLALELMPFVQHGHVIEVKGKTEPSARVMVNGQEVPVISKDGDFHYFTPPLPNGENIITVTAQNSKGGVNTQQKKVVIQ